MSLVGIWEKASKSLSTDMVRFGVCISAPMLTFLLVTRRARLSQHDGAVYPRPRFVQGCARAPGEEIFELL